MHMSTEQMPIELQAGEIETRAVAGGDVLVRHIRLPAGTDFTPLFEGLPDDACQCPHWGYVTKGAVHIRYTDGSEEVTEAGAVFYWPAGHTGWVEQDTAFLDFSPEQEHKELMVHVARKTGQSA